MSSSTSDRSFLDSNILLYVEDRGAPAKKEAALRLYEQCRSRSTGVVSTQVLQEYFAAATRKLSVPPELARRRVELFARLDVHVLRVDDVLAAIDLHRLHGLSFWDGLIVRAALVCRCAVLFSEDLQHGRRFDGVEVVNPFR